VLTEADPDAPRDAHRGKRRIEMLRILRTTVLASLIVAALIGANGEFVEAASPPEPTYGTAVVDGDYSEWDTDCGDGFCDFFADMYQGADPDKDVLSKLYVRYDCSTGTLYALVLAEPYVDIEAWQPGDEHSVWVADTKVVDGDSDDFAWIGLDADGNFADGWEASGTVAEGSYQPPNGLYVHTQVQERIGQVHETNQTSSVRGRDIPLEIACCTGSITIEKEVIYDPSVDDDTVNFGFDGDLGSFQLDDPQTDDFDGVENAITFNDVSSGIYAVTESSIPSGWELQNISCPGATVEFGSGGSFHSSFQGGDDTVRIILQDCGDVTCTFVNDYAGTTSVGVSSFAARSGAGNVAGLVGLASLLGSATIGLLRIRRRRQ
jgi:hypothetical protein